MSLGNWEGCIFHEPEPKDLPGVQSRTPQRYGRRKPTMNRRTTQMKKKTKIILGVVALVVVIAVLLGV